MTNWPALPSPGRFAFPSLLVAVLATVVSTPVASQMPIDIRGYFGDPSHQSLLESVLFLTQPLPNGATSPLPNNWSASMPLAGYTEPHTPLYLDPKLLGVAKGRDTTVEVGLEVPTLAFYAGHGQPDRWSTPDGRDNIVFLNGVQAGDGDLRYFWLHSCNVLAHGSKQDNGDYGRPDLPGGQTAQNAFARWQPAVGTALRLACGGSTRLGYAHAEEIWDYLLVRETTVADAWILGLAQDRQVPACLAAGAAASGESALADRELISEARREETAGEGAAASLRLHLQYPVEGCQVQGTDYTYAVQCGGLSTQTGSTGTAPASSPASLPLLVPSPCFPGPPVGSLASTLSLGFRKLTMPSGDMWKYHDGSGGLVLIKEDDRYQPWTCGQPRDWSVPLRTLLGHYQLEPGELGIEPLQIPEGLEMRTETSSDGGATSSCASRSLFLRFPGQVQVGGTTYPIFGPTLLIEVQQRDSGLAIVSLSAICRRYKQGTAVAVVVPQVAHARARQAFPQVMDEHFYPDSAVSVRIGYEQASERCVQAFLRPTYELRFAPGPGAPPDTPTVLVRMDARQNPSQPDRTCSPGEFH